LDNAWAMVTAVACARYKWRLLTTGNELALVLCEASPTSLLRGCQLVRPYGHTRCEISHRAFVVEQLWRCDEDQLHAAGRSAHGTPSRSSNTSLNSPSPP